MRKAAWGLSRHSRGDILCNKFIFAARLARAGAYDAIVLAVAHAPYKAMGEADFAKLMRHDNGVFADLKGLYRGQINTLEYWSL